jgi:hypothetical protein
MTQWSSTGLEEHITEDTKTSAKNSVGNSEKLSLAVL